ncbi:MAG TPA: ankyrin repeat domain-containing protein [Gammaproteobacteria bacterium]|nr:ankyrin repeat domain-containing protein [Gammaproteobacteria bacterium]
MEYFIEAVKADDAVRVEELLHSGIHPNQYEDSAMVTPLHFAAQHNSLQSAKVLIRAGAEIDAETADGVTPIEVARLYFHEDMIELLLNN